MENRRIVGLACPVLLGAVGWGDIRFSCVENSIGIRKICSCKWRRSMPQYFFIIRVSDAECHFPGDLARVIHNAGARVLDRNVQSSKMVHAALLHLMLEAAKARPRFSISLKRSTPKPSAVHNAPADYPIFRGQSRHPARGSKMTSMTHFAAGNYRIPKGLLNHIETEDRGHLTPTASSRRQCHAAK